MTEKREKARVAFEEMNLQTGTRLQLVTYNGTRKSEYYSSVIGYEPGRYIFIRMPQENGFNVPLKLAERVEIRIFSGVSIFTFSSCVEYIYQTPRNFVELAFPDNIRAVPLRKNLRIPVRIPVKVRRMNGEKQQDEPPVAMALDLSVTGLMLQSNINLGEVGDQIGVAFYVRNTITEENTLIEATTTIRNAQQKEDDPGQAAYRHGVFFQELRPFHRATIQNFINDNILLGRQQDAQNPPS